MRIVKTALTFVSYVALSITASAQSMISQVGVEKPKAGHSQQYEAGRKLHMAFHKSAGDTWTWHTYEQISGDGQGNYIVVSPGHAWKDFDGREEFQNKDSADHDKNVSPHLEWAHTLYSAYQAELSLTPPSATPSKFILVTHFRVKPEGVKAFRDGIKKINEGIRKTNSVQPARWHVLANGGDGPTYTLVQERNSWAEMEGPEKGIWERMADAFGKEEGEALRKSVTEAYWNSTSYTLAYRPDLSYIPAK